MKEQICVLASHRNALKQFCWLNLNYDRGDEEEAYAMSLLFPFELEIHLFQ